MSYISFGNKKIVFNIKRTRRKKTVCVRVVRGGDVVVYSPRFLQTEHIKEIVKNRARWIVNKQHYLENNHLCELAIEFVSGEAFSYLGRQYRLKVVQSDSSDKEECKLMKGRFVVRINRDLTEKRVKENVRNALINWYLNHAKEKIPERVELYRQQLGKDPKKIEIKSHRKRWGSCSQNGVIRFNWKIMMAPITVLDYVIVHELCHLMYPNHSDKFWAKVGTIIPDYAKRRERLRNYGPYIDMLD